MSSDPFSAIIGHETVCGVLTRALAAGRLAHAYLFVGPIGCGRRTVAEALAKTWLGTEGNLDSHPDFMRLARGEDEKTGKEKTGIVVAQVRELVERFGLSSFSGRKLVLIEEADRLIGGAANALLKTLEEPRGDAMLILRAERLDAVPATLVSRCQVIRFTPVPRVQLAVALEVRGLDAPEAARLAARSFGCPGRALRLMRDGEARAEDDVGFDGFMACFRADLPSRLKAAAALLPRDETDKAAVLERTLDAWEHGLRDLLLTSAGCTNLVSREGPDRLAWPPGRICAALRALSEARRDAARNVQPLLALEHIILA